MMRLAVPAFFFVSTVGSVAAASCPADDAARRRAAGRPECRPAQKLEPHDPDRQRAARRPGFIDLGNGTEVRVGGRVRMDYDARSR